MMRKSEWAVICIVGMFAIKGAASIVIDIKKKIDKKNSSKKEEASK